MESQLRAQDERTRRLAGDSRRAQRWAERAIAASAAGRSRDAESETAARIRRDNAAGVKWEPWKVAR